MEAVNRKLIRPSLNEIKEQITPPRRAPQQQKKPVPPASFVKHQLITPKNVDLVYPLDARVGNRSASVRQERATAQFA